MTDVAPVLRAAVLATPDIADNLSIMTVDGTEYPSVYTIRPLPGDATYPLVAISPDISYTDSDFLSSDLSIITRDIMVIGRIEDYRLIERMGRALRKLFHRNNGPLFNTSFHVVSVTASGPFPAPVDETHFVGRIITLTIRTQEK